MTFDYPYEGPPTCVHGGVIAELFDEMLGLSNILVGLGAMTGTLTIRYRRPTPLLAPLELAARHTGSEGRKVFAWGGIYHEGELTAEAEGIFIHVAPARMLDIVTGNAHGAHSAEGPLVDADWQRMMEKAARAPPRPRPAEAHLSALRRTPARQPSPRRRSSSPVRHPSGRYSDTSRASRTTRNTWPTSASSTDNVRGRPGAGVRSP